MSAALVRRWFQEVWNERKGATIDDLFAPDAVAHGLPGVLRGPAAFRAFQDGFLAAFPDVRVELEDVLEGPPDADGTVTVAARFRTHMTHHKNARPGQMTCMSFSRWRDGRCVESWDVCDFHGLRAQVGELPF